MREGELCGEHGFRRYGGQCQTFGMSFDYDLGKIGSPLPGGEVPQDLQVGFDRRVCVLTAGVKFVLSSHDCPVCPKIPVDLGGDDAGLEADGEDIVGRGRCAANSAERQVDGAHAGPCTETCPRVSY